MQTVTSKDGTIIAFDQAGQGPALILVGGMFEQRAIDSETAKLAAYPPLVEHFTVIHYDRRGRGDSTDTLPFAVEREIEDIAPAHLSQWWGPVGFTNTFAEFDLRPGGLWRFVMHGPDGATYPMDKEFVEVEEHTRIALYHPQEGHRFWMMIDFAEQEAGTCLTWRMRFESAAELASIKPYLIPANEQNLDRLAAYLAQLPQ